MPETAPSVADRAAACFDEGHNCAQSVLMAVAEARGMACPRCIPAVALAMGGGIGHTGRACGALTGAVMALGLAVDRAAAGDIWARKAEANRLAEALVGRFIDQFGTPDCATLLGFCLTEPDAFARYTREDSKRHTCAPCVRWAAAEAARVIDETRTGTA